MALLQGLLNGLLRIESGKSRMFIPAGRKVAKGCNVREPAKFVGNSGECGHRKIMDDVPVLFELSMNAHRVCSEY